MTKCNVCEARPVRVGGLCHNCAHKIEAEKRHNKAEQPVSFFTYRGHVVGLYRNGGSTLVPKLMNRNPDNLPKSKTLDLNTYLEGFTRERVKSFKACVLKLAGA